MVQFPSGLIITADEPIDCRLVLTSAEMLAISNAIKLDKVGIENENISNYNMPEKYFCINKDDGRVYYFYFEDTEHCNEWQEGTGYFKVSEYRLDESLAAEVARAIAREDDIDDRAIHKSWHDEPVAEDVYGEKFWHDTQHFKDNIELGGANIENINNINTLNIGVDVKATIKDAEITNTLLVDETSHLVKDVTIGEDKIILDADDGNINATGKATIENGLEVNNNVDIAGDTSITGVTTIVGNTSIAGETSVDGKVNIVANGQNELVDITGPVTVDGNTDLTGVLSINGGLNASGPITATGNVDITGSTNVTGNTSIIGNTDFDGSINITANEQGESVSISGPVGVTGNTDITGDLSVTGALDAHGPVDIDGSVDITGLTNISGNTSITGALSASDDTTLNKNLHVVENTNIDGNLNVTGATVLADTLTVEKATTLNDNLTVTDNKLTVLGGTLEVKQKATLDNELEVKQKATLDDELEVKQDTTLDKNLHVVENTNIDGTLEVKDNTTLDKALEVKGNTQLTSNLNVTGTTILADDLTVNANETINGNVAIDGSVIITANDSGESVQITGPVEITGSTELSSNVHVTGTIESTGNILTNSDLYVEAQKASSGTENALKINSSGKVEKIDLTTASPTKAGKALEYIDSISQDSVGKISATKKEITLTDGGQGTLTLNDSNITITNLTTSGKPTFTGVILSSEPASNSDAVTKAYVDSINTDLQSQIDTIEARADVIDVVECYDRGSTQKSDIAHYNISAGKVSENDIIKVLIDETHDNAVSYYRYVSTSTSVNHFDYVGSVAAYYTKAETDAIVAALDYSQVGENGNYIKYVSEADGVISATLQAFDTTVNSSSTNNNAPTSKAVDSAITTAINDLDVSNITSTLGKGKTLTALSETDGKISATAEDISITSSQISDKADSYSSTGTAVVTGKSIKAAIDTLSASEIGADGSYLKKIKEENGVISATTQAFDTDITSSSTDANVPTTKAVYDKLQAKQNNLTASTGIDITNDAIKATGVEYKNNTTTQINALKFVKMTEAQYNALPQKDADTLYMLTED